MAERLSLRRRLAYALGAPGFQITDRIVVAIAIFYYLPPGDSDLMPQVSEATFLGVLTAFGAARLLGGVVDSLADPLVGWARTDRARGSAAAACSCWRASGRWRSPPCCCSSRPARPAATSPG